MADSTISSRRTDHRADQLKQRRQEAPRFKNEMYFPEQGAESSTAYETTGPTTILHSRHRSGIGLGGGAGVGGAGGVGAGSAAGEGVGGSAVGGDGTAMGDDKRMVARGRGKSLGAGAEEKAEFTPGTCMAISGRGDDLLFFEAGLQEYFYRSALTTAVLRIIIALSSTVLVICLGHNAVAFGFVIARFTLDEAIVSVMAPFEHHPILLATRWVSFSWAGIASFVLLLIAATAKRSAKLRHPEVACARMNQLFLHPQFGMHYEVHTDTLNVVKQQRV